MCKRLSILSIGLGLFAMLMIHVGPLYSALQLSSQHPIAAHTEHGHHAHSVPTTAHHHAQLSSAEPDWVAALKLCGYCDLLTLNPPLVLSLELVLPEYRPAQPPVFVDVLLQPLLRYYAGHPRAPPVHFYS